MTADLKNRVVRGAAWFVAIKWALRLTGLISTAILARILTPEDFGTVAAVIAIAGVVDAFFDFGFDMALIKNQDADRFDYDTAWTMRILKMCGMGLAVFAVSPLVSLYAETPVLVDIAGIVGLSIAIRGLENIGLAKFQKDLDISKLFYVQVIPKLLSVVTSIALALLLRSYWALAFGMLASAIYSSAFSYVISNYRPRLSLVRANNIWSFSKWVFLRNLSRQLIKASDQLMLSGLIDKALLGKFSVSNYFAGVFTVEFIGSAGQALTPGIAQVQKDPAKLRSAFMLSVNIFFALIIPAGIGVYLTANELTLIILGPQWVEAVPLVTMLALVQMAFAISQVISNMAMMFGLNKSTALISLALTITFIGLFHLVFRQYSLNGVILWKLLLIGIEVPILLWLTAWQLKLSFADVVSIFWRPFVATALMYAAVSALPEISTLSVSLAIKSTVGAAAYVASSLALWHWFGRPDGIEKLALDMVKSRLRSQRVTR